MDGVSISAMPHQQVHNDGECDRQRNHLAERNEQRSGALDALNVAKTGSADWERKRGEEEEERRGEEARGEGGQERRRRRR